MSLAIAYARTARKFAKKKVVEASPEAEDAKDDEIFSLADEPDESSAPEPPKKAKAKPVAEGMKKTTRKKKEPLPAGQLDIKPGTMSAQKMAEKLKALIGTKAPEAAEPDYADKQTTGAETASPEPQAPAEGPFHLIQPTDFPLSAFGGHAASLLQEVPGPDGAQHFAQAMSEAGLQPEHEGARKALGVLHYVAGMGERMGGGTANHPKFANSKLVHSWQGSTNLPVGHVRVSQWIPGDEPHGHNVLIHYPQGQLTGFRAPLNDEKTGYAV